MARPRRSGAGLSKSRGLLELAEAFERDVGEHLRYDEIRIWPSQLLGKSFDQ